MQTVEGIELQPIVDLLNMELDADGFFLKDNFAHHQIFLPNGRTIPCRKVKFAYTGTKDFTVAGGRVAGNLYIVMVYDVLFEEIRVFMADGQRLNTRIGSMSEVLKESEFERAIHNIESPEEVEALFEPRSTAIFLLDSVDDKWVERIK